MPSVELKQSHMRNRIVNRIQSAVELSIVLSKNEFKSKYKTAYFGFAWILITPLIQMAIISTVFSNFFSTINYSQYILLGLICWQFVSNTISLSTYSFTNHADILHKTSIFAASLPISSVLSSAYNYIASLLIIAVILIMSGSLTAPPGLLPILAGVTWLIVITLFLSLFTSTMYVYFRDIGHAIQSVMMIWFYASPIIWPLEYLPAKMQFLLSLNPIVTPLFLIRSGFGHQLLLDTEIVIANIAITAAIMALSIILYRRLRPQFVDYV
jgi:ABC-type polysaccharide/polyol phosphate export permease